MTRTASPDRECHACKGLGLIFPPAPVRTSTASAAVRAMPVPCSFCEAGEIERRAESKVKQGAFEFEIFHFRKVKG